MAIRFPFFVLIPWIACFWLSTFASAQIGAGSVQGPALPKSCSYIGTDSRALPVCAAVPSGTAGVFNVQSAPYNATGNTTTVLSCGAITSGTTTYFCGTASFTSADVGKVILIHSAGVAGAPLQTTIVTVTDATDIVIADTASTTVDGTNNSLGATYGTDDTSAVTAAIVAATAVGDCAYFPAGSYWLASQTTAITLGCLTGVGYTPQADQPFTGFGSTILISNTASYAFTPVHGFTVQGMTFFYPGQDGYNATPVTYPALFGGVTIIRGVLLNDTFVNPYRLMQVDTGGIGLGDVRLIGDRTYCVNTCFYFLNGMPEVLQIADSLFTVGVFEVPGIVSPKNLQSYTALNGEFIHSDVSGGAHASIDGLMMTNNLIHGYRYGIHLLSGFMNVSNVIGNNWDSVPTLLSVDGTSFISSTVFSGNEIYAQESFDAASTANVFEFPTSDASPLSEFTITGNHVQYAMGDVFLEPGGSGANKTVTISGNTFENWGQSTTGPTTYYGIAIGANNNIRWTVTGNAFRCNTGHNAARGISVFGGISSIVSNQFDACSVAVTIAGTVGQHRITANSTNGSIGNSFADTSTAGTVPVYADGNLWDKPQAPTIGTGAGDCGTSPTNLIYSSDFSGVIVVGTTPSTQCTVTFQSGGRGNPICFAQNNTHTSNPVLVTATDTRTVVLSGTIAHGDQIAYSCSRY